MRPAARVDLYVFCVQTEKDSARWNALDLDQWRFYVLRRKDLERRGCRNLSFGTVARLAQPLTAAKFRQQCLSLLDDGSSAPDAEH